MELGGHGQLLVRLSGGNDAVIECTTTETVGEVKSRVSEAYGQDPCLAYVFDSHGEEVADEQSVTDLVTAELNIIFANDLTPISNDVPTLSDLAAPTVPPCPTIPTIGARMALTGQALKVELDTSLSVGAVRQQIAVVLGTGEDMVVLMGSDGENLLDAVTLDTLGLAEICVVKRQRNIELRPSDVTSGDKVTAMRRLCAELSEFEANAPCGFTAEEADPTGEDSIFCWRVHFPWPANEAEGCEIIMRFSFNYPFCPPEVFFVEDVQHWAVTSDGRALMDVLGKSWSPAMNGWSVACGLSSVLHDTPVLSSLPQTQVPAPAPPLAEPFVMTKQKDGPSQKLAGANVVQGKQKDLAGEFDRRQNMMWCNLPPALLHVL